MVFWVAIVVFFVGFFVELIANPLFTMIAGHPPDLLEEFELYVLSFMFLYMLPFMLLAGARRR
jgi:hypothetical protein